MIYQSLVHYTFQAFWLTYNTPCFSLKDSPIKGHAFPKIAWHRRKNRNERLRVQLGSQLGLPWVLLGRPPRHLFGITVSWPDVLYFIGQSYVWAGCPISEMGPLFVLHSRNVTYNVRCFIICPKPLILSRVLVTRGTLLVWREHDLSSTSA